MKYKCTLYENKRKKKDKRENCGVYKWTIFILVDQEKEQRRQQFSSTCTEIFVVKDAVKPKICVDKGATITFIT